MATADTLVVAADMEVVVVAMEEAAGMEEAVVVAMEEVVGVVTEVVVATVADRGEVSAQSILYPYIWMGL